MTQFGLRSKARGISLIELMISLVIGLVVVGAVIVSIIGSGNSGRYQSAFAQMNEDAQIALSILRRDIEMAGYSQPTAIVALPAPQTLVFGTFAGSRWIYGCELGFANPAAAAVACNALGSPVDPMIEVAYEADVSNTQPVGGVPSNCLGNAIPGAAPFLTRNRYFVSTTGSGRPELRCSANANTQPLVENIESMKIWYGVAVDNVSTQVVRYVTADAIGAAQWDQVISVKICVLVRSADPVLSAGEDDQVNALLTKYRNCDSLVPLPADALQTSADRRLRRAYFATAALRTKMPQ